MILRHGTRYPGKKHVPAMIEKLPKLQEIILDNYQKNKTGITSEDAASFAEWRITFTEDDIMKLTEEGENEMIDLGERYQARFPTLMTEIYDNQTYRVKKYCIFLLLIRFVLYLLNFSSNTLLLNVPKLVHKILPLDYLADMVVTKSGIQKQNTRTLY